MAGMDAGAAPRGHDKRKKKKKMRRVNIRIDMTPMVDVAFLLLTFFMLTTSMSRPQTMEINLPPGHTNVEVPCSNLLTVRVKEDGSIFWNVCNETPQKVSLKEFRKVIQQQNAANSRLITLIKIDRKGKYAMMVDVIDEMNLANISRFSIAPWEDGDTKALQKAAA